MTRKHKTRHDTETGGGGPATAPPRSKLNWSGRQKTFSRKKRARRALTIAAKQKRQHKSFPYFQQIWRDSLFDLIHQLDQHCVGSKSDKLRFQNGRLIRTLRDRIEAAGKTPLSETQLGCYVLMTTESLQLGYDEPRGLHLEELKARSATGLGKCNLGFLLNSIASWVEAQESFDFWLAATQHDPYWQLGLDSVERTRVFAASYLSKFPELISQYEGVRIGSQSIPLALAMKSKGITWTRSEWAAILKRAATIASKPEISCAESDRWTWWCYPVFRRYGWSAREVQQAACERGYTDTRGKDERDFRRYWIARGLRFAGKRTNRRSAPLSDFVKGISVPRKLSFGVQIWD